jgi:hypothetical protein
MKTNRRGPTQATPEALNGTPSFFSGKGVDLIFRGKLRLAARSTERNAAVIFPVQLTKPLSRSNDEPYGDRQALITS